MEATVREIESLQTDLGSRNPTAREVAAAAAFLADFYTGVENILKRISRCYGVALPAGEDWHIELFNRFCEPGCRGCQSFLTANKKNHLPDTEAFRHVIRHGYAIQLDWDRMARGIREVNVAYSPFRAKLQALFGV